MTKVAILMSTYNGEKYVEEQVRSLFSQEDVSVRVFARDDGSSDRTVEILDRLSEEFDIQVIRGENIGWRKSFMELVRMVPAEYDYYAFSDQDDVWKKEKMAASARMLEKAEGAALCCSTQTLVDGNLNYLCEESHHIPKNFREAMTNVSCRGCAEVFNNDLLLLLKKHLPEMPFAHDRWVARVANCLGEVYYDSNSYILYRQHDSNSAGNNYKVSFKRKIDRAMQNYKNRDFYYWYAKEIIEGFGSEIPENRRKYLDKLVAAKRNPGAKFSLLFSKDFISESLKGTVLLKIVMFFGLYQKQPKKKA